MSKYLKEFSKDLYYTRPPKAISKLTREHSFVWAISCSGDYMRLFKCPKCGKISTYNNTWGLVASSYKSTLATKKRELQVHCRNLGNCGTYSSWLKVIAYKTSYKKLTKMLDKGHKAGIVVEE